MSHRVSISKDIPVSYVFCCYVIRIDKSYQWFQKNVMPAKLVEKGLLSVYDPDDDIIAIGRYTHENSVTAAALREFAYLIRERTLSHGFNILYGDYFQVDCFKQRLV